MDVGRRGGVLAWVWMQSRGSGRAQRLTAHGHMAPPLQGCGSAHCRREAQLPAEHPLKPFLTGGLLAVAATGSAPRLGLHALAPEA